MKALETLFNKLLKDIRVKLSEEFDQNFTRKAFFDKAWQPAKRNKKGSLMLRTGNLRRSLTAEQGTDFIKWSSSLPYADIHNNGGKIVVTAKMKKYFWYQYRLATGGNSKNENKEALGWKYMALMKEGTEIKIPQRQFIGNHPQTNKAVENIVNNFFKKDITAWSKQFFRPDSKF